jgi:hypothetical protein
MSENFVICHYRPRAGQVDALLDLVREHRVAYRSAGLATDRPETVYVGQEQDGSGPLVVTIFEWIDAEASRRAHQHPAIGPLWERMEALCEARGGRPSLDFPHFGEPEVLP